MRLAGLGWQMFRVAMNDRQNVFPRNGHFFFHGRQDDQQGLWMEYGKNAGCRAVASPGRGTFATV